MHEEMGKGLEGGLRQKGNTNVILLQSGSWPDVQNRSEMYNHHCAVELEGAGVGKTGLRDAG